MVSQRGHVRLHAIVLIAVGTRPPHWLPHERLLKERRGKLVMGNAIPRDF